MYTVLLIDDKVDILVEHSRLIVKSGYECLSTKNFHEAVALLRNSSPDVIFLSGKDSGQDCLERLDVIKSIDPVIPVILFCEKANVDMVVKAMKLGAFDFIEIPFDESSVISSLQDAVRELELNHNPSSCSVANYKNVRLPDVIGESPAFKNVARRVLKVAETEANVFISGESGTGKELIAKSIHNLSSRRDEPFIAVDCVSLPPTLIESELFGYEKGAFSGAIKSKPGLLELADGGTLFLDEITELDIYLQAKLLRVIQERQFRRVGGSHLISVDFRVIAATNRVPEKAVEENMLRKDLYYRLNVVPIKLPALRERKEDINLLVNYFMEKYKPIGRHLIKGITRRALKALNGYRWPGNIRELQNAIEQSISMAEKQIIDFEDLPENIMRNQVLFDDNPVEAESFKEAKDKYLKQFYKMYMKNMIKKHNGNISEIARSAEISRGTIYKILEESNISENDTDFLQLN